MGAGEESNAENRGNWAVMCFHKIKSCGMFGQGVPLGRRELSPDDGSICHNLLGDQEFIFRWCVSIKTSVEWQVGQCGIIDPQTVDISASQLDVDMDIVSHGGVTDSIRLLAQCSYQIYRLIGYIEADWIFLTTSGRQTRCADTM